MPCFPVVHSYGTAMRLSEIQSNFTSVSQLFTDRNSCDLEQDGASSVLTAWGWTLLGSSVAFWDKQGGKMSILSRREDWECPASFQHPFKYKIISTVHLYKLTILIQLPNLLQIHSEYLQETALDCNHWVLIEIKQNLMSVSYRKSHISMLID